MLKALLLLVLACLVTGPILAYGILEAYQEIILKACLWIAALTALGIWIVNAPRATELPEPELSRYVAPERPPITTRGWFEIVAFIVVPSIAIIFVKSY